MTPQEALDQVAPRGRAAPKLKNALREDAYEVFEAWASQSAAAAAEDLAAATARSADAGREAAAIKAAMDKKKKKKSMAEADYAPVAAGERVQALAVLRAAGPDYDLPWASRCATCHALLALGERYAGEEFEFGAGPAGMAGASRSARSPRPRREAAAPETREPDDAGDFRKARRLALDAALALWPANRVARQLADAAPSGASLVADLERLVADAAAAGGDDPRLPL
ncbi:hypothetical protein JL722_7936 [Aureococcus anophagefferens]|nr:hypothetical protein JL722_7936 [Aureococcus anophagefferens]